jgi:hypothetical protein
MAQRSLHIITKVYYKSMSCFAMVSPIGPACSAKVSPIGPSLQHVGWAYTIPTLTPPSNTQCIVFLISRKVIPYWTRGGTCCPKLSTPKIQSLADSSNICHDGINHLYHSNHCSNHNIDPTRPNYVSTDGRPHLSH